MGSNQSRAPSEAELTAPPCLAIRYGAFALLISQGRSVKALAIFVKAASLQQPNATICNRKCD